MSEQSEYIDIYDPEERGELFDGILSRRFLAWIIDLIVIGAIIVVGSIPFSLFGVATFGFGFFLYPAFLGLMYFGYIALTLGGPDSATWGMKALGLELRMADGRPVYALMAIFHALCFWFLNAAFTPLLAVVGLFNARSRLVQDFLTGTVMINKERSAVSE